MNPKPQTMTALLTYEDYCLIPEDGNRHEIIEGRVQTGPFFMPFRLVILSLSDNLTAKRQWYGL